MISRVCRCRAWRTLATEFKEIWEFIDTTRPIDAQQDFISKAGGPEFTPRFLIHFSEDDGNDFGTPPSPSPFTALCETYSCKDALSTLEGLEIHIVSANDDHRVPDAWDTSTFRSRHLSSQASHLKLLHLELFDPRTYMYPEFPPLSTPEQMLNESPFQSVVLRNISPQFLLGRLEIDNLKYLEVSYRPGQQVQLFSLEVLQIFSIAPQIETPIFNANSYHWAPRSVIFVKRPARLTVAHLKNLSLKKWPAEHLQYLLSSIDLPSIQHFSTSTNSHHSPKNFDWMKDGPSEILSLAAQCRSARCHCDVDSFHISTYHSERPPPVTLSTKPSITYSDAFQRNSSGKIDNTPLNYLSSILFLDSCIALEIDSPMGHSVVSLINLFKHVKFLRLETPYHLPRNKRQVVINSLAANSGERNIT